jgi:predicted DNA-binding transcriptional regulator YafY
MELEVTNESVERPEFDQHSYFKYAVGISASNKANPVKVVLKADDVAAKYIETQPFHNSQTKQQNSKDKGIFEMYVFISEELIRSILSFAGEVEVLEPAELRNEIRRRTQKMNDIYLK